MRVAFVPAQLSSVVAVVLSGGEERAPMHLTHKNYLKLVIGFILKQRMHPTLRPIFIVPESCSRIFAKIPQLCRRFLMNLRRFWNDEKAAGGPETWGEVYWDCHDKAVRTL